MNNYTCLIALAITFCSLAIAVFLLFHCRRMERECNRRIAQSLCEQDRMARQLEQMRIEKEAIENVLRTKLSEAKETGTCETITLV